MASEQGTRVELRRTRKKLAETKFFLGHLEKQTRTTQQYPDAFDFYLSAFLSAARSVTSMLQVEDKDRYDRVFPGWHDALSPEDRRLFRFMYEQRRVEVHEEGAKVDHETSMIPVWEVWREPSSSPYFIARFGGPYASTPFGDDYASAKVGVLTPRFEIAPGEYRDAMEVCRRYVGLLEDVVRACEQAPADRAGERSGP